MKEHTINGITASLFYTFITFNCYTLLRIRNADFVRNLNLKITDIFSPVLFRQESDSKILTVLSSPTIWYVPNFLPTWPSRHWDTLIIQLVSRSITGFVKYCRDKDRRNPAMEWELSVVIVCLCARDSPTQPELIPYSQISTTSKQVKTPLCKHHWTSWVLLLVSMQIYWFVVHCGLYTGVFSTFPFQQVMYSLRIRRPYCLSINIKNVGRFLKNCPLLRFISNTDWFDCIHTKSVLHELFLTQLHLIYNRLELNEELNTYWATRETFYDYILCNIYYKTYDIGTKTSRAEFPAQGRRSWLQCMPSPLRYRDLVSKTIVL